MPDFANRILPVIHVRHVVAFDPAAAGEAHERGLQAREHLAQVRSQAVVLPGLGRRHTDHVEPKRALAGDGQGQLRLGIGVRGRQIEREPFPLVRETGDFTFGQVAAVRLLQGHADGALETAGGPGGQSHLVLLAFDDIHAPVAFVDERRRALHLHAQALAIQRVKRPARVDGHLAFAVSGLVQGPMVRPVGILERPVPHKLRVDPTIGGEIDILEEDAPERGTDLHAGLVHVHGQRCRSSVQHTSAHHHVSHSRHQKGSNAIHSHSPNPRFSRMHTILTAPSASSRTIAKRLPRFARNDIQCSFMSLRGRSDEAISSRMNAGLA